MNDAAVELAKASLERGGKALWHDLNLAVKPGEFVAVLGPNGAGKTSLLKVLLGQVPLSHGRARVLGHAPGQTNRQIGYVPQQKAFDRSLPIRGRDLVELGLNGHQFGFWHNHKAASRLVDEALGQVGATRHATAPIDQLSGGEQQRLRVAQAIIGQPRLLLCDEPLLSLDLASQATVTNLLHEYRKNTNAAVLFVTHEINPVLPWVDKVLYIAAGRWVVDTPKKVLQSKILSQLYGTPIEVLEVHGRVMVIGTDEAVLSAAGAHHEEQA